MILYRHRQTKEDKNMVIRKIGEFYYDGIVANLLFLLSEMDIHNKINFLQECRKSYSKFPKNITARRLVHTIDDMLVALNNNETITLEG